MTPEPTSHAYEGFDLLIGSRTADGYPLTITSAPAGDAKDLCRLDPASPDIQTALTRLEDGDADEALLRQFGRHLFGALFTDEIASVYQGSYV